MFSGANSGKKKSLPGSNVSSVYELKQKEWEKRIYK